ncbi:hypothetical protein ACFY9N_13680 [Microbacterium sp. NPDC008134]|uniref:hypothetical protein n=1 Tax=Microbacterium sp. NPDC008134 TaxID=3364183 RepID=UPI0036E0D64A
MTRPAIAAFGDAHEFLAHLRPAAAGDADANPRLLVGALIVDPDADAEATRRAHDAWWDDALRALRLSGVRAIAIVVDASSAKTFRARRRSLRLTSSFVKELDVFAGIHLGRDVTTFGITISRDADRTIVAERLHELAERSIVVGDQMVVRSKNLRAQSIRELMSEALL